MFSSSRNGCSNHYFCRATASWRPPNPYFCRASVFSTPPSSKKCAYFPNNMNEAVKDIGKTNTSWTGPSKSTAKIIFFGSAFSPSGSQARAHKKYHNIQNTIFAEPTPHRTLQSTIFAEPTPSPSCRGQKRCCKSRRILSVGPQTPVKQILYRRGIENQRKNK